MFFNVVIDPRSSEIPSLVRFYDEDSLTDFVIRYVTEYYPDFKFTNKTNLFKKLCSIEKLKDSKFKILEIYNVEE